jgi:hypothetical protein
MGSLPQERYELAQARCKLAQDHDGLPHDRYRLPQSISGGAVVPLELVEVRGRLAQRLYALGDGLYELPEDLGDVAKGKEEEGVRTGLGGQRRGGLEK